MTSSHIGTTRKLFSTLMSDGRITLEMRDAPLLEPGPTEVVIAVEAVPVNPADMMSLWPGMDLTGVRQLRGSISDRLEGQFPTAIPGPLQVRIDQPLVPGLEGAGTVITAGREAKHLIGKRVTASSLRGGMFARHCTVEAANCVILPDHVNARDGAAFFTNPLTVAAILETLRQEGQRALIHTAAASNLGQMLARACTEDGIDLVAVVRHEEQAALLQGLRVPHICNSTAPDFMHQLVDAARATDVMIAFDAVGGGDMPHRLLAAMTAAYTPEPGENPYGTRSRKKVFLYGRLDPRPPRFNPSEYGALWNIEGWAMPEVFEKAGEQRSAWWRERILGSLHSTFSSQYSRIISVDDLLDPEILSHCFQQKTGGKLLIEF